MKSISFIFLALISSIGFCKKSGEIIYVDGNNNEYIICYDSLVYNPITMEESSSGEYSGGEKTTIILTEQNSTKIFLLIHFLIEEKSNHLKTRNMGCGTLITKNKTYYIDMSSQHKIDLEAYLKGLIEQ